MGNRAVITTRKDLKDIGVYLHWNGGRDSVEGFITYCKIKGYRPPEYDNYGWGVPLHDYRQLFRSKRTFARR